MKFNIALLLCFGLSISGCGDDPAGDLKLQRRQIDKKITPQSLSVYTKLWDKPDLLKIENRQFPDGIRYTYNILKDEKNRIVYINEMPFSMKHDWFISYKSYFDTAGNLFAFQRQNNFLKNKCTKGAVLENYTRYYEAKFKVIDSKYTLTDTKLKSVPRSKCVFPYNFPYKVIKTLKEYKKEKGIPD